MTKAAALGLAAALLDLLIRRQEPAMALLLGAAGAGALLALGLDPLRELGEAFSRMLEDAGVGGAVTLPVVKSLGITLTGRYTAELCRDAGQSAPASALETVTAAAALYAALPLIRLLAAMLGAGG